MTKSKDDMNLSESRKPENESWIEREDAYMCKKPILKINYFAPGKFMSDGISNQSIFMIGSSENIELPDFFPDYCGLDESGQGSAAKRRKLYSLNNLSHTDDDNDFEMPISGDSDSILA